MVRVHNSSSNDECYRGDTGSNPVLTAKIKVMKEYKWGRVMTSNQIGLMITWGTSTIPNRRYVSLDIPFLIIQFYI